MLGFESVSFQKREVFDRNCTQLSDLGEISIFYRPMHNLVICLRVIEIRQKFVLSKLYGNSVRSARENLPMVSLLVALCKTQRVNGTIATKVRVCLEA